MNYRKTDIYALYVKGDIVLLRLLEILKLEGGAGESLPLLKKYKDVPSGGSIPDTAITYVALGYAEMFRKNGRKIRARESLDCSKNYKICLTPAGDVLAAALPPLLIGEDFSWNANFWMGYSTTLRLAPTLVSLVDQGNYPALMTSFPVRVKCALAEYAAANLIGVYPNNKFRKNSPIIVTEAGREFSKAIVKAEQLAFKGHPVRAWFGRRSLAKLEN
ncbi:MAG: hypothetical protein PHX43_08520 [Alphaproteobacteria bacterium]|nr:hypothetical protein [Alphaproteobacteria bacterium]